MKLGFLFRSVEVSESFSNFAESAKDVNNKPISDLLTELGRCEMSPFNDTITAEHHTYNGVNGSQGVEGYSARLEGMYGAFANEVQQVVMSQTSEQTTIIAKALNLRIEEVLEHIARFDVPTKEAIAAMECDISAYKGKVSQGMINELNRMKFFAGMAAVQRHYAERVKTYLDDIFATAPVVVEEKHSKPAPPQQSEQQEPPHQPTTPETPQYLYGYEEIGEYFRWRRNKICNVLKNPQYAEAVIRDRRKVIVDTPKLIELMRLSNKPRETRPKRKSHR